MTMSGKIRRKWFVDFTECKKRGHRFQEGEGTCPPGYIRSPPRDDVCTVADASLVAKMGWSIALGPWKQLPVNLFVLWMAGNSISLFPIMMVGMMLVRPVQAIFTCKQVFKKLSGDQAVLQMLVYLLANVVGICLGLYKVNAMGLLPTHQSDWLEFMIGRDDPLWTNIDRCIIGGFFFSDQLGYLAEENSSTVACELLSQFRCHNNAAMNLEMVGGGISITS